MNNDKDEDKSYQHEDIFSPAYFQKVQQQKAQKERQSGEIVKEPVVSYSTESYASVGIVAVGVLGVTVLTLPHVWPALGISSFMGIDFALWYDLAAFVAWASAIALIPPLFWKASGQSNNKDKFPLLKRLWGFLPHYGSYSPRLFILSLVLSQMFFLGNHLTHQPLKSMDTWKTLEAQHLDSRDPAKRALFAQQREQAQQIQKNQSSLDDNGATINSHSNTNSNSNTIALSNGVVINNEKSQSFIQQSAMPDLSQVQADTEQNMKDKHYSEQQIEQVKGLFQSAKEVGNTLKDAQNQQP